MTTPAIPVKNRRSTTNPILTPNGPIAASTYEGEMAWLDIPEAARKVHRVPDCADQVLISMDVFCDSGFEAHYTASTVTITTVNASAPIPGTVKIVPPLRVGEQPVPMVNAPALRVETPAPAETVPLDTTNTTSNSNATYDIVPIATDPPPPSNGHMYFVKLFAKSLQRS